MNLSPAKIIEYTNKARKKAGLPPLKVDKTLNLAATNRGKDMAYTGAWEHKIATTTPGVHWSTFIKNAGTKFDRAGENLARGQDSAKEVVKQWMESETHKKNLLDPNFTRIGVATRKGGDGKNYVYQYFAQ